MNIKAEINSKLYFNSHLLSPAYANQSSRIYSTDIFLLIFYVVQHLSFIFLTCFNSSDHSFYFFKMNNQNNVFNIIFWNIQGLKTRLKPTKQTVSNTKLNIKSIKSKLSKFGIICLQETWAKDGTLTFQGCTVYSTVKNTVSRRGQAGLSVLIRDHHQNFVSRVHSDSPNIIWCRLDKQLLGLQAGIFLAAVYLPPLQSQRKAGEDVISILEKEIHKYSIQGQILLLGDFNARTGT